MNLFSLFLFYLKMYFKRTRCDSLSLLKSLTLPCLKFLRRLLWMWSRGTFPCENSLTETTVSHQRCEPDSSKSRKQGGNQLQLIPKPAHRFLKRYQVPSGTGLIILLTACWSELCNQKINKIKIWRLHMFKQWWTHSSNKWLISEFKC